MALFQCIECNKLWEFYHPEHHKCDCGHVMIVDEGMIQKARCSTPIDRSLAVSIGVLARNIKNGDSHLSALSDWQSGEQKSFIYKKPNSHGELIRGLDLMNELKSRWKTELEEMLKFAKEGLGVNHIIEDLQKKLASE